MANFLDTLKERIVVFDGAMGTNLQVQNLTLEDFGGLRFEAATKTCWSPGLTPSRTFTLAFSMSAVT